MRASSPGPQHTFPKRVLQALWASFVMLQLGTNGHLVAASFVDAMVAQVGLYTIAASDVALARALGLYGLVPERGPIRAADIDRVIDARLIVAEAERLGISPSPEAVEKAWREVAARRGGMKSFQAWLEEKGISRQWARKLTYADAQRIHFAELRFERFVFIPEEQITRALGPGRHSDDQRERVRETLRKEEADRALTRWLERQRKQAKIRRFIDGEVPDPFASSTLSERRSTRRDDRPDGRARPVHASHPRKLARVE